MSTLTHAELVRQLADNKKAADQTRDQIVAEAEKEITSARHSHRAEHARLEADHLGELARREKELAGAAQAVLRPICTEWRKQPTRELASRLAKAWRSFTSECQQALGKAPGAHHLSLAFVGDDAGDGHRSLAMGDHMGAAEHAHRLAAAIDKGDGPAAVEAAIGALETRVDALHGRPITPGSRARLDAIASQATHTAAVAAYRAVEAAEAAEAQRQFQQDYVPPKNMRLAGH